MRGEVEHEPQRLQQRHIAHRGGEDQRRQHHPERQHQQADRRQQHIADRFQPQQPPAPVLDDAIGAVEADAQALDAAGGEVDRKRDADGEQVAAGAEQHPADFAGDRGGHLGRPHLQQDARHLVGELGGTEQEAGQRGDQDQEREQRHQRRQRDMAGDRPAVIGEELVVGVARDAIAKAERQQRCLPRPTGGCCEQHYHSEGEQPRRGKLKPPGRSPGTAAPRCRGSRPPPTAYRRAS